MKFNFIGNFQETDQNILIQGNKKENKKINVCIYYIGFLVKNRDGEFRISKSKCIQQHSLLYCYILFYFSLSKFKNNSPIKCELTQKKICVTQSIQYAHHFTSSNSIYVTRRWTEDQKEVFKGGKNTFLFHHAWPVGILNQLSMLKDVKKHLSIGLFFAKFVNRKIIVM